LEGRGGPIGAAAASGDQQEEGDGDEPHFDHSTARVAPVSRTCGGRKGAVEEPRWWTVRSVSSLKPATYRCPFCTRQLHAMSDHVLIAPEGDTSLRRHAHTDCVAAERRAGRLPTRDEWRATQPRRGRLAWLRR
jgi:hypothetical protein